MKLLDVGTRIQYIKTHEGHLGTITGTVYNSKNELAKISMKCDCGASLWVSQKDIKDL